jgi:hypothetical protein
MRLYLLVLSLFFVTFNNDRNIVQLVIQLPYHFQEYSYSMHNIRNKFNVCGELDKSNKLIESTQVNDWFRQQNNILLLCAMQKLWNFS